MKKVKIMKKDLVYCNVTCSLDLKLRYLALFSPTGIAERKREKKVEGPNGIKNAIFRPARPECKRIRLVPPPPPPLSSLLLSRKRIGGKEKE